MLYRALECTSYFSRPRDASEQDQWVQEGQVSRRRRCRARQGSLRSTAQSDGEARGQIHFELDYQYSLRSE